MSMDHATVLKTSQHGPLSWSRRTLWEILYSKDLLPIFFLSSMRQTWTAATWTTSAWKQSVFFVRARGCLDRFPFRPLSISTAPPLVLRLMVSLHPRPMLLLSWQWRSALFGAISLRGAWCFCGTSRLTTVLSTTKWQTAQQRPEQCLGFPLAPRFYLAKNGSSTPHLLIGPMLLLAMEPTGNSVVLCRALGLTLACRNQTRPPGAIWKTCW